MMQRYTLSIRQILTVVAVVVLAAVGPARAQIYYLDEDQIWKAELDGSNAAVLVGETDKPRGIAVDEENDYLYWTDDWEFDGHIVRAALDGSGMEVLYEQGTPRGIALDPELGKLYWADLRDPGAVMRANLDGSEVETVAAGESGGITDGVLDVALDAEDAKVYWTSFGEIMRADLDGSNVELFVDLADHIQPTSIVVASGYAYWVNPTNDSIERSSTGGVGGDVESVVSADEPAGLAVNSESGKLYWLNSFLFSGGGGNVMRADLDGSNAEQVLDGMAFPEGPLAVVGSETETAAEEPAEVPSSVQVVDVYPTPFRGAATLVVTLERSTELQVDVVDVLGRSVAGVHDGRLPAGRHELSFRASLPSGLYFVRALGDAVYETASLVSVQ